DDHENTHEILGHRAGSRLLLHVSFLLAKDHRHDHRRKENGKYPTDQPHPTQDKNGDACPVLRADRADAGRKEDRSDCHVHQADSIKQGGRWWCWTCLRHRGECECGEGCHEKKEAGDQDLDDPECYKRSAAIFVRRRYEMRRRWLQRVHAVSCLKGQVYTGRAVLTSPIPYSSSASANF